MNDDSLTTSSQSSRGSRLAISALVISAPGLVTCALLFGLFHATLLDHFPVLSDEIAYHHQIDTFVRAGFNGGYFNFDEQPAPLAFTHFSAHGPAFPLLYGLLGKLVGWHLYSGPMFNLGVLALATAVFIGMTRASRGQIVATGIVIVTSWWVLLMAPVTMQDSLHQAVMIVMAAFAARLLHPDTRRPGLLLLGALGILAVASVVRPTNWIVAVPLVVITFARRPLYAAMAAIGAGIGIPIFWLIWRYISAPIPNLGIELPEVTNARASEIVLHHFLTRVPENVMGIFNLKAFLEHPVLQHAVWESVAMAVVFAVCVVIAAGRAVAARRAQAPSVALGASLPFKVDAFNALALGMALFAFVGFYYDDGGSISRVTAPFLLLSLLVLVATKCRKWVLFMAVLANVLIAPSFITRYREWRNDLYTYSRARADLFRQQLSPLMAFEDGQPPWCNTLLTMSYQPEIVIVPAGIGLSVGEHPEDIATPIKSRYLLLNGNGPKAYGEKAHLQHLGTTTLGELYLNLDAVCH